MVSYEFCRFKKMSYIYLRYMDDGYIRIAERISFKYDLNVLREVNMGERNLRTCANLCSISCSCCNALTKAVLSLFVCSAFNAFFTLFVTHCSQTTLASLAACNSKIEFVIKSVSVVNDLPPRPPLPFDSHFQTGVKSD